MREFDSLKNFSSVNYSQKYLICPVQARKVIENLHLIAISINITNYVSLCKSNYAF